jgi:Domain of unknown function (DUF4382)
MQSRSSSLPTLAALLGGVLLAGCQARTDVSATGNTPAQYTHVFLTISQVWFNTSATALAGDSGWIKFTLAAPQTIDLVSLDNGTLSRFASQLKLAAGTYARIMIVLSDSTDALTAAAQSAGATANDEVDYVDANAVAHSAPLAVLNAAQGIDISTSLTVVPESTSVFGSFGKSGAGAATSSAATTGTFSVPVVTTTSAVVDFDASRDLVPVSLSGQPAFLLSPRPDSNDVKYSGSIQGTVSLASVAALTTAGLPDVQVSAEALSSDGTRHVVIRSTRVNAGGSFALYPLSTASGAPSAYDVVIHGPDIQTVIVKSVTVAAGAPGAATAQLGTLTLTPATPFRVNVNPGSPAAPASSSVGFYQTLPLPGEVPYLVESRALDPVSGLLAADQSLSGGSLQYGAYVSGGTIALTSVNPGQGAGTYSIAAINPAYGTAALGTTVTSPGNTTTALFTMSAPPLPAGSSANAIAGTVSIASLLAYDNAELFLTAHGALVATASLNGYLGSSQSALALNGIAPGGSAGIAYAPGLYDAEVWAWNSANPTGTLSRLPYGATIDLTAGNAAGVALNIH